MELLYVWIKKYKNIEGQGFNFSPKWRFHYNPENGKLDVEDRREKVIDNFFGKHISNVTAIVGENGSGKSSLLHEVGVALMGSASNSSSFRNIAVYFYNDLLKIYSKSRLNARKHCYKF